MSSMASYSAMTGYIMLDTHISLISLQHSRKVHIIQKSKMWPISVTACFRKDTREHKERGSESSEPGYDSKLQVDI